MIINMNGGSSINKNYVIEPWQLVMTNCEFSSGVNDVSAWHMHTPFYREMSCSPDGNRFLGVFGAGFYSEDGIVWKKCASSFVSDYPLTSAYIDGYGWIVTETEAPYSSSSTTTNWYAISTDGINFTSKTFPASDQWTDIAVHGKDIVVYGSYKSVVLHSTNNGSTWTQLSNQGGSVQDTKIIFSELLNKWVLFRSYSGTAYTNVVTTTSDFKSYSNIFTAGDDSINPIVVKEFDDCVVGVMCSMDSDYEYCYICMIDSNSNVSQYMINADGKRLMATPLEIFKIDNYYYLFCRDGSLYRTTSLIYNDDTISWEDEFTLYKRYIGDFIEAKYANGVLSVVVAICDNENITTNNIGFGYILTE